MFGLVKQKRFNDLQEKYNRLQERIDECERIQSKNKELDNEIANLKGQLFEVRKQIREQTEADLYFISAKIQKKLLDGEPKENLVDLRLAQSAYQQHLAAMQQQTYPQSSFLAGLGLGNLFGR